MDNSDEYKETDETNETYYAVFSAIRLDYSTDSDMMQTKLDCLHAGQVEIFTEDGFIPGLFDVYFLFEAPHGETRSALIGYAIEQLRNALRVDSGLSPLEVRWFILFSIYVRLLFDMLYLIYYLLILLQSVQATLCLH